MVLQPNRTPVHAFSIFSVKITALHHFSKKKQKKISNTSYIVLTLHIAVLSAVRNVITISTFFEK